MIHVKFLPSGNEVNLPEGGTILQAALEAGLTLDSACGGNGLCGKCRVRIQGEKRPSGASAFTSAEKKFLSETDREQGWFLACQHVLTEDTVVVLPEQKNVSDRKLAIDIPGEPGAYLPSIRKIPVVLKQPDIHDQRADWERLCDALPIPDIAFSRPVASSLPQTLRQGQFSVTAVLDSARLLAVEPGDTTFRSFGLAIDIGTTTLVVYLVDLTRGTVLASAAAANPQAAFGADVVSRISHAADNPEALHNLQTMVAGGINGLVSGLACKMQISLREIYQAAVVGNTTMVHLFLGIDPSFLARSPFIPAFQGAVQIEAGALGLNILETAPVEILPNVAGYVGSDTVGMMLAAGADRLAGVNILVDIGTNGEIVLTGKGSILTCSAAAGPAFEGAKIQQGMRAANGAIERVRIASDVEVTVIGGEPPAGICGSGLVDAVSGMLRTGIVEYSGRLVDKPSQLQSLPPSLRRRLRTKGGQKEFVLAWGCDSVNGEDIAVTQKDIRELQLAKGAIAAGIRVLLQKLEIQAQEIDGIFLAGAFGNYIGIEAARGIGLLPAVPVEKIKTIGNAAGKGAQMALLSTEERKRARLLAQKAIHIELSAEPLFQEEFIRSLSLGEPGHYNPGNGKSGLTR